MAKKTRASRAGSRALTQKEFRIIAATTLGYYLLRDVVKRKWPRRVGQAAVLATGVGLVLADEWDALSDEDRQEITEGLAQAREAVGSGPVPGTVVLAAGATAAVGAGAWLNGRVDAAGAAVVSGVGGRVPLIGGVFRALPSTIYGAAQLGVLYVVNERVGA